MAVVTDPARNVVVATALPDIDGILIADSTGESMTLTPDEARSLANVKLPAALAALRKAGGDDAR